MVKSSAEKAPGKSHQIKINAKVEDKNIVPWSEDDPRFWQTGLWLLLIGIALRQIALARAPYSSDEAIHAWFTQDFYKYTYDPVYHGPLLYHLEAAIFSVLRPGLAGDYIGRLLPSLLGIACLAVILGPARRWLGTKGALWTLGMMAISPVMVAYSRVLIHDALVMLLTLGAVLCFQRSLETHSWTNSGRQARIGLVALLTLFLCTKANVFFIVVMLTAFWVISDRRRFLVVVNFAALLTVLFGVRWIISDWPHEIFIIAPVAQWIIITTLSTFWIIILFRHFASPKLTKWLNEALPLSLFFIVAFASVFALRQPDFEAYIQHLKDNKTSGFALSLAQFTHNERLFKILSVFCVAVLGLWALFAPNAAQIEAASEEERQAKPRFDLRTPVVAGWVAVFLFFYLYGHGVKWWQVPVEMVKTPAAWAQKFDRSVTAISATIRGQKQFDVPPDKDWTAGHLAEAPDWDAAISAVPRMLSYWGGQQKKPRLPGRHDYYLPLMILYELPLVLAAIGGIWHASRRRTPFGDLLLWWAFTSFVLYAVANEKVPWLLTHIMFPLILLAGMWLGDTQWKSTRLKVLGAVCVLGAIFLLRNVLATSFGRPNDQHEPMFYAQTTENFRDTFQKAMTVTAQDSGDVWLDAPTQWPAVWWLRPNAPFKGNANMAYNATLPDGPIKVAVISVENWEKYKAQLPGWRHEKVDYFIWPRASWPALRPKKFWDFWVHRKVNPEYKNKNYRQVLPDGTLNDHSLLAFPGEWSNNDAIIAWK